MSGWRGSPSGRRSPPRSTWWPRSHASSVMELDVTREELVSRLGDPNLVVLDVRSEVEYAGTASYPCDVRQGHLPGARHLDLGELMGCTSVEEVRERVGLPEGSEIVAYCHSGSRSATAAAVLRAAGYE